MRVLAARYQRRQAALEPVRASWAFRPFSPQQAFVDDLRRVVAAFAGVRAGKTQGGADKVLDRGWQDRCSFLADVEDGKVEAWAPMGSEPFSDRDTPRKLYWVVGATYALAKVAWVKLIERMAPVWDSAVIKATAGEVWWSDGTLWQMKTGKDEAQLQGARVDGVWVDEVCVLPEPSWNQILNRLTDRQGWAVLTGSPRPGTWPKYRLWDAGESKSLGLHHWHTADNPHIPPEEIERAKREMPELWYKRDFEASWDTFDGLVYSQFSATENVKAFERSWLTDRGAQVSASVDFGIRRPACALTLAHPSIGSDGGEGDIVVDELVLTDVSVIELAHALADRCDYWRIRLRNVYADPAGNARTEADKQTSVMLLGQVLRERGVLAGAVVTPTEPAQRSVANGIRAMQARIRAMDGTRRWFISTEVAERRYPAGIVGTMGSVQGYRWRTRAGAEDPDKDGTHDHFMDSLRYREVCLRPPGRTVAGRYVPQTMAVLQGGRRGVEF
jgi:hypothetical protein